MGMVGRVGVGMGVELGGGIMGGVVMGEAGLSKGGQGELGVGGGIMGVVVMGEAGLSKEGQGELGVGLVEEGVTVVRGGLVMGMGLEGDIEVGGDEGMGMLRRSERVKEDTS